MTVHVVKYTAQRNLRVLSSQSDPQPRMSADHIITCAQFQVNHGGNASDKASKAHIRGARKCFVQLQASVSHTFACTGPEHRSAP